MALHTGRFIALLTAVSCLIFTSCGNDHIDDCGKGDVMLSLYSDVVFKSPSPISDVDDFNFRFVGVDGYATSEYYRYGDVSWPFKWYTGVYKLQAESCTEAEADEGYGCLRYEGTGSAFSVIYGKTTTAQVTCLVANVGVNVVFDDSMFETFSEFRLDVETVVPQLTEEGKVDMEAEMEPRRTLTFDSIEMSGYFSIAEQPTLLRYRLYVKEYAAEEFIDSVAGYFTVSANPAVLKGGDLITLRVKYIGEPVVTPGIKFIVSGERTSVNNSVILNDYLNKDEVVEDE